MTNTIALELTKAAEWRASMVEQHPEEPRNQLAAVLLQRLATETPDAAVLQRYNALHDDEDAVAGQLSQISTDVLHSIGFGYEPGHINQVIETIVAEVVASSGS